MNVLLCDTAIVTHYMVRRLYQRRIMRTRNMSIKTVLKVVASRRHPIVCVWINIPGLRKHRYHYAKYFDVKRSHTQASALPKPLATGMLRMKQDGDAGIFLHAKTEDMTI